MAKEATREASERSEEKFQIVVLTAAMIAFFLALCTLVLSLFLKPAASRRFESLKQKTTELWKLLDSPDMRSLRTQAKLNERTAATMTIGQIVSAKVSERGLRVRNMPPTGVRNLGGIEERKQEVTLEPAPLLQMLQFLGDVKDSKPTIQVHSVKLNRERRGGATEKVSWNASFTFVDYVSRAPAATSSAAAPK